MFLTHANKKNMLTRNIIIIILIIIFFAYTPIVSANNAEKYKYYLDNWNQKIKIASESLENAEKELKNGNEIQACIKQREAADYGIEATESLIMAFKISGSTDDLSNIESGLNKWKELKDFC